MPLQARQDEAVSSNFYQNSICYSSIQSFNLIFDELYQFPDSRVFYLKFFDEFYQADMVEAQAGKTEYAFWPLIHFVLVFGS